MQLKPAATRERDVAWKKTRTREDEDRKMQDEHATGGARRIKRGCHRKQERNQIDFQIKNKKNNDDSSTTTQHRRGAAREQDDKNSPQYTAFVKDAAVT